MWAKGFACYLIKMYVMSAYLGIIWIEQNVASLETESADLLIWGLVRWKPITWPIKLILNWRYCHMAIRRSDNYTHIQYNTIKSNWLNEVSSKMGHKSGKMMNCLHEIKWILLWTFSTRGVIVKCVCLNKISDSKELTADVIVASDVTMSHKSNLAARFLIGTM